MATFRARSCVIITTRTSCTVWRFSWRKRSVAQGGQCGAASRGWEWRKRQDHHLDSITSSVRMKHSRCIQFILEYAQEDVRRRCSRTDRRCCAVLCCAVPAVRCGAVGLKGRAAFQVRSSDRAAKQPSRARRNGRQGCSAPLDPSSVAHMSRRKLRQGDHRNVKESASEEAEVQRW